MEFSDLKVGSYVVFKKEFPCKVLQVNIAKPGKHGHVKKMCVGIDLITDKKYSHTFTHHSHLEVPEIVRNRYFVNDISNDGFLSLMDNAGEIREDLRLGDDEVSVQAREYFEKDSYISLEILEATVNEDTNYRFMRVFEED